MHLPLPGALATKAFATPEPTRVIGCLTSMPSRPTTPRLPESGEWRDVADVGSEVARNAWAEAAREVLLDAAARYRTVVTHKELASEVQERTGVRTTQLTHYWVGDVLGRVAAACAQRGEPLLSSLCVNTGGQRGGRVRRRRARRLRRDARRSRRPRRT